MKKNKIGIKKSSPAKITEKTPMPPIGTKEFNEWYEARVDLATIRIRKWFDQMVEQKRLEITQAELRKNGKTFYADLDVLADSKN